MDPIEQITLLINELVENQPSPEAFELQAAFEAHKADLIFKSRNQALIKDFLKNAENNIVKHFINGPKPV